MNVDPPPPPSPADAGQKVFKVGTLVYTRAGLFTLFAWLLWADVCFVLHDAVMGLTPLKYKALEAPNWLMALLMSTIPMALNATICPWVSFTSDRHRGKLGRRIPFILYTAPFLTLAMLAIGYSKPLGHFLHGVLAAANVTISTNASELIILGVFGVLFAFFNMFVGSVFWYLFNDLVPEEVLSRFLSVMRMVSTGTGAFYSFFIFRYAETHMEWIFLGGAILYFVTFTLLCLNVKEGNYPPPPPNADGKTGLFSGIKTYGQECYSHGFYWTYYLYVGFACIAASIGMFNLFFQMNMGLTLEQIGKLAGIGLLWPLALYYFGGALADRFHPLRTLVIAVSISTFFFTPIGLIWLFVSPSPDVFFYVCLIQGFVWAPIGVLQGVSAMPTEMRIFPKERYGQFCSANALVRSVLVMCSGVFAGAFIDFIKTLYGGSDFAYRYIAVWQTFFALISLGCLFLTYRKWKQLGGDKGFIPPEVGVQKIAPGAG